MVQDIRKQYYCCMCNTKYLTTDAFYQSGSLLYQATGHMPICKGCLRDVYLQYVDEYGDQKKAILRLCMNFDIYYNDAIIDACLKKDAEGDALLGKYIRQTNMIQNKGKNFGSSIEEGVFVETLYGERKEQDEDEDDDGSSVLIDEDLVERSIERWGRGFDFDDYEVLNEHYKLLKDANPNCDSNQEIFINDLCYTKMQQMKAVREGRVDDFNKLTESYRKSFQQAGLKTVRDAGGAGDATFGTNIGMIENYTPAEYYKNKKLYKDFDGIGEYFKRFVQRPLRNLMYGTEDRDEEFFVGDEGDGSDEFADEE